MSFLSFKSSNTCDVNDNSSLSVNFLLWCHNSSSMFGHVESSNNINFEYFQHLLRRNNTFWWYNDSNWNDTGTIDDSTDFTEFFNCELEEFDDILLAADVSFKKLTSWQFLSQGITEFFIEISDDYFNTMRSKKTNCCLPETRCTTRDYGN